MKYGIIYNSQIKDLGEDILTYSVMKQMPKIDYIIEKNNLNTFVPEKEELVNTIIYGNFASNSLALPPSPFINPLFLSINFVNRINNKTDYFDKYLLEYLSDNSPIGLENSHIINYLEDKKVDSYTSGSLILTLEAFKGIKKGNKICLVDINKKIKNIIAKKTDSIITETTNIINEKTYPSLSFEERMDIVEKELKLYQSCNLVITSRMESALAALALKVPTIFIYDDSLDYDYYKEYLDLINSYEYEEYLEKPVLDVKNQETYLDLKEKMNKTINKFIKASDEKKLKPEESIDSFKKYVDRKKAIDLKVDSMNNEYQNIIDEYKKKYNKYYMIFRLEEIENQLKEENRIKTYNKKIRVRIMRRVRLSLPWRILRFIKNKIMGIVRGENHEK